MMKHFLLLVIICCLCLDVTARTGILYDNVGHHRKEEIRTMKKTKALVSALNTKSGLMFKAKLALLSIEPDTRGTINALRKCKLPIKWDICTLKDDFQSLKFSTKEIISEYQYCKENSLGNLQFRDVKINVQYPNNNIFIGNFYVTIDKKGKTVDVFLVSEDLHKMFESLDDGLDSEESNKRLLLLNWMGKLQTQLIIHNLESIKEAFTGALWISKNNSQTTYGMENCRTSMSEDALLPYNVDIHKHLGGRYYRTSMKVDRVSSDKSENNEIVIFWDLGDTAFPNPLVFAWIGENEKTIQFNDLPLE